MIREMLVAVLIGLVLAAIFFLFGGSIFPASVYKSWSTKECVKVEPASAGSCEDLPGRYETIWIR